MTKIIIYYFFLISTLLFAEKSITISRVETPIIIDGIIEDSEWANAAIAKEFFEIKPAENQPSITETKVLIQYDKNNLYIAFKAFDIPEEIRARQSKRDEIFEDDRVGVILDPQDAGVMAYVFASNPYGNQGDSQKFGQSEREDWDAVWSSSGRITLDGYEVEMAIPFSTFRVSNSDDKNWRISFYRVVPRGDSNRINSWVPNDRNNRCDICQLGYVNGIKDINTRSPIELLPSTVGSYDNAMTSNIGLGISVPLGTSGTAEITINPDFSQVESNATRIDVNSTTALSYPETRPFFNEGIDLFNTGSYGWKPKIRSIYTRSINQPIVAAKILGQFGDTQYGYLGAKDQNTSSIVPFREFSSSIDKMGESFSNILRVKHALDEGAYIGGLLSDRRYKIGSGTMGGVDGLYRINRNLSLDWQLFFSNIVEPDDTTLSTDFNGYMFSEDSLTGNFDGEVFSGHSAYLSLERTGRDWGSTLLFSQRSPTFRADNGYLDVNDEKRIIATFYKIIYPVSKQIDELSFVIATGRNYYYDMSWSGSWLYLNHDGKLAGQFQYELTFITDNQMYLGLRYNNDYSIGFELDKNISKTISIGFEPQFGTEIIRNVDNPYQARNIGVSGRLKLNPNNKFKLHIRLNQSRSTEFDTDKEIYSDLIARLRLEYQGTSALNLRLVTQYHDFYGEFDIQPLISFQPDPFSIYYIGMSKSFLKVDGQVKEPYWIQNFSQVYIKAQKLFSF